MGAIPKPSFQLCWSKSAFSMNFPGGGYFAPLATGGNTQRPLSDTLAQLGREEPHPYRSPPHEDHLNGANPLMRVPMAESVGE